MICDKYIDENWFKICIKIDLEKVKIIRDVHIKIILPFIKYLHFYL